MANFLHDDIVWNILARLPAKPLLRFRCVSREWNCMLTEPNFMKFRSRKTIILPLGETLQLIDDNVPIDDAPNSVVSHRYPFENLLRKHKAPNVIGTFNGIVVLAYSRNLILYNPFTCVSKVLPCPSGILSPGEFGLGCGANSDVLKLVKFRHHFTTCDVFNFRESSWSSCRASENRIVVCFQHSVGHCVNGFLYWIVFSGGALVVLNVNTMVLSKMNLPFKYANRLGTMNGGLCILGHNNMWVMKEHNKWFKIYSFKLPLYIPLCILVSGRILMKSPSSNLIIYIPGEKLCHELNISVPMSRINCLEYVESLVSPLDAYA